MPLAGPVFAASFNRRFGKVSSAAVSPASRLNWRSRFQMRSPASSIDSAVKPPSQAASTCGAMSSIVQANVVNTHKPVESTAAVASWKALTRSGLPSVDSGSVFTGTPMISEDTV